MLVVWIRDTKTRMLKSSFQCFSVRVCALLLVDAILKKTVEVKVRQRKQFGDVMK